MCLLMAPHLKEFAAKHVSFDLILNVEVSTLLVLSVAKYFRFSLPPERHMVSKLLFSRRVYKCLCV